jgi:hypothetical protein
MARDTSQVLNGLHTAADFHILNLKSNRYLDRGNWSHDGTEARITAVLDFDHRPVFKKLENVSETGSLSILRQREKTPILLGPLDGAKLNLWFRGPTE